MATHCSATSTTGRSHWTTGDTVASTEPPSMPARSNGKFWAVSVKNSRQTQTLNKSFSSFFFFFFFNPSVGVVR